jgi:hypothetical protein
MRLSSHLLALLTAGALVAPAVASKPPPPPPPPPRMAPPRPPAVVSNGGPARIEADLGMLTAAQQPAMQACLFEGAREAGAKGATTFKLAGIDSIEPGNGGWRFSFRTLKTNSGGQSSRAEPFAAPPTAR